MIEQDVSPLVSVIMPAFNVERYIRQAMTSVVEQSLSDLELIVVDDCSQDTTLKEIEEMASRDARIRILVTEGNSGSAAARNIGLESAKGRLVAFLDADDRWAPEKLQRQVDKMRCENAQICYTAVQKVDVHGRRFGEIQDVPTDVDYAKLLGNPLIVTSSALIDFKVLGKPLMPEIRKRQDFAFWLQLLRNGAKAVGINEPLTYYRVRPGSLSSNKLSAALNTWHVYRKFEKLSLRRAVPAFVSYVFHAFQKRLNR